MKSKSKKNKNFLSHEEFWSQVRFTPEEENEIEGLTRLYIALIDLRRMRRELKLTQTELSKRSGIPRETISRIETGDRNPTYELLSQLGEAMGYRLGWVKMD